MEVHRQFQLRFKQALLAFAVQLFEEVIQADFADSAQLSVAVQASQPVAQFRQVGGAVVIEVHRMQAKGSEQAFIRLHQVPQTLPILLIHAQHHHALHAQGSAVGEDCPAITVEVRKVQVGVGVDQLHAQASRIRCLNVRPMACTPGWYCSSSTAARARRSAVSAIS